MIVTYVDPGWEWQIAMWLCLPGLLTTPTWPVHDEPMPTCPLCGEPRHVQRLTWGGIPLWLVRDLGAEDGG